MMSSSNETCKCLAAVVAAVADPSPRVPGLGRTAAVVKRETLSHAIAVDIITCALPGQLGSRQASAWKCVCKATRMMQAK